MSDVKKPLPIVTSSDRPFWEGAKRHELMAYKCVNCGALYYPAIHCVEIFIGMRVEVVFDEVTDDVTLHRFRAINGNTVHMKCGPD
jgi:uncharacterized OB-fold protein